MCACMYAQRTEEGIGCPGAQVIDCEPPHVSLEVRLASSARTICPFTCCPSSQALYFIKIYFTFNYVCVCVCVGKYVQKREDIFWFYILSEDKTKYYNLLYVCLDTYKVISLDIFFHLPIA